MRPELGMTAQTLREEGFWQMVDKIQRRRKTVKTKRKAARENRDSSLDVKAWLPNCWRIWESPGRVLCPSIH